MANQSRDLTGVSCAAMEEAIKIQEVDESNKEIRHEQNNKFVDIYFNTEGSNTIVFSTPQLQHTAVFTTYNQYINSTEFKQLPDYFNQLMLLALQCSIVKLIPEGQFKTKYKHIAKVRQMLLDT